MQIDVLIDGVTRLYNRLIYFDLSMPNILRNDVSFRDIFPRIVSKDLILIFALVREKIFLIIEKNKLMLSYAAFCKN